VIERDGTKGRLARARRFAFSWAILLFALTSWPRPPEVPVLSTIPNFDKLVHFGLYGVQAFLLYLAIAWPGRPRFSLLRVVAVLGVMAVWAIVDETHQYWIPGRSMDGWDVIADCVGAAGGAVAGAGISGARRVPLLVSPSPRPSPGGRGSS
jgi:VanZ family protein